MTSGRWVWVGVLVLAAIGLAYPAAVLGSYLTIPRENTDRQHFDAIIVLGNPSLNDGSPGPEQRERVLEAVAEYRRHVADHIIMTGGAAHNRVVEAHSMRVFAITEGVPEEAVLEEGQAADTVQNVFYSDALMGQHGWTSAEVVSSPSHLARTALILKHWPIAWRTHAAHWPGEYGPQKRWELYWHEATLCWKLRRKGFGASRFVPAG